jgi:hypothetical protein
MPIIQSDNAKRLEVATIMSLAETGIPSEESVHSLATQLRALPLFKVSDEEFASVIRKLHEALQIDMGLGSRVIDGHTPWLQARKAEIEPFYWRRYQRSLRQQGWAPKVVNALDQVTDEILDLSGNPSSENGWPRRGLVMGDVQSGKTSNYTGLICKAADAGYKLIILLTGTLESLRRQTQERLDAGFVGLDSSGVVSRNKQRREIGVGLIDGARAAGVFTSTLVDFRASTVNQLGFRLKAFNEPVLLVVKKNKRILENLTDWIRDYNASANGNIDLPMLLIDDEADNASVNTSPERVTAINAAIRSLLRIFPRSTYIGFTATPFANVFIHPDSSEEMLGDDLFPRDFVYALDPPTNYLGAAKIFGDESPMDCLRTIADAEPHFPRGHDSTMPVEALPSSMIAAVQSFLLANAIMDGRPNVPKHRSMLVNVSHYTDVQNQVRQQIDEYVRGMQEDIRNYAALSPKEALRNASIRSLHDAFKAEFSDVEIGWPALQKRLGSAILPIVVRAVNQRSGAASLAYSEHAQDGLRVIAVGGNSLSRGLTLEGLVVSYFYRTTAMYDTLLQMGRWFGYRPGFEDLLRIWMSDETANWYSHISEASEELRSEIRHMQASRLRPSDFGMKVRSHPDALLITARNKMRHSSEVTRWVSISEEGLESPRLWSTPDYISGNYRAAVRAVEKVIQSGAPRAASSIPLWTSVDKSIVIELLNSFVVHPLNVSFHPADLARFLESSADAKLRHWDVAVPNGAGLRHELAADVEIQLQKRKLEVNAERRYLLVNERKMRVGSRGVEKSGMSQPQIDAAETAFRADADNAGKLNIPDRAYRPYRARPLLVLHFLEGTATGRDGQDSVFPVPPGTALTAIGLSFPRLGSNSQRVTYRINLIEIKNLLSDELGEDPEEDDEDED